MMRSVARSFFDLLRKAERRVRWLQEYITAPAGSFIHFTCNLCARRTSFPRKRMTRETPSCIHCGSTVRFRSIVHALSTELFGESLTLKDFPVRKDLVGVGMSDWRGYASQLERKLQYVNTYYHKEPLLDIMKLDVNSSEQYDFMISTEVFEHVPPPVARAFHNAFRMLKPGGVFIFSVPYREGKTKEHFPQLHKYTVLQENRSWILLNQTEDGQQQRFDELVFHGGPGTTLEMREFGSDSVAEHLTQAGFQQIRTYTDEVPRYGIVGTHDREEASVRMSAHSLESPPWAARKQG